MDWTETPRFPPVVARFRGCRFSDNSDVHVTLSEAENIADFSEKSRQAFD